jgi:hypothetical protein
MDRRKGLNEKIETIRNNFSNFIIDYKPISTFKTIKLSCPNNVNTRFRFNTIQEIAQNGLTNEYVKVQIEQLN